MASLKVIERFFFDHGAAAVHQVSPNAGVSLLCARNYRPIEISNVPCRGIEKPEAEDNHSVRLRVIGPEESELYAAISTRGWAQEHPELLDFLRQIALIATPRDGVCASSARLTAYQAPLECFVSMMELRCSVVQQQCRELRRRGLQAALVRERMRHAFDHGCDLAMMVAAPGSNSQRNAERNGFKIAYTRTKWRLSGKEH